MGDTTQKRMRWRGLLAAGALGVGALAIAALAVRSRNAASPADAFRNLDGQAPFGAAVTYPREGTLFPPELPPPEFRWQAEAEAKVARWVVRLAAPGPEALHVDTTDVPRWRPPADAWTAVKQASTGADATFAAVGLDTGSEPVAVARTTFRTSTDAVGAPILYRSVPLPFIEAVKHPERIAWRLLDVGSPAEPPVVLEKLPVCGNCHSLDAAGRVLGMDVDYANDKGSYALVDLTRTRTLTPETLITWSDYRRADGEPTFGLLSRVSPDGRYAVSTVKDRSVFVARPDLAFSQLFFPIKGILAAYDRTAGTFTALAGADDPRYVQSNPAWSPDGRWVYFARAEAAEVDETAKEQDALLTPHLARDFVEGHRTFRFDLYRVPFAGGAGGRAEPVAGATDPAVSEFFPKVSPDGRWLVFCRAESFMLLQPDSELWIVPAEGGKARRLEANTDRMNSWHAWSPSGRWLVFATKARGPYTQLALTHIDAEGRSSPPVFLERAALSDRAANIPEFVNVAPSAQLALTEAFLDANNYRRQGQVRLLAGDVAGAVPLFEKALAIDPADHAARLRLAAALTELGDAERAKAAFTRLLADLEAADEPDAGLLAEAHAHAAALARSRNRSDEAMAHYRAALLHDPDAGEVRLLLALTLAAKGRLAEAEAHLAEAVRRDPDSAAAHLWHGQVLDDLGREAEATAACAAALAVRPVRKADAALVAARVLERRPAMAAGVRAMLEAAVEAHGPAPQAYALLARAAEVQGDAVAARAYAAKARSLAADAE